MDCYNVEDIEEILNMFINLKTLILNIYPVKEEIKRFFDILNFCFEKEFIDYETICYYLTQLNNNLCFNEIDKGTYSLSSFNYKIAIYCQDFCFKSFDLFQYIVVSKENLQVIKDVERQLEEKINQIISKNN